MDFRHVITPTLLLVQLVKMEPRGRLRDIFSVAEGLS